MLEIQRIRNHSAKVTERIQAKGLKQAEEIISEVIRLDDKRKEILSNLESLRAENNRVAKTVGALLAQGKKEEAEAAKTQTAEQKTQIKQLEEELETVLTASYNQMVLLPNVPHDSVPVGKTPEDNVVAFQNDIKVTFDFTPVPHWELALKHDIIDWELGVKITGAGFPVYKGKGAILQRALIQFFLNEANKAGYTEIQPPIFINRQSGFGTGQLPDKDGQMYYINEDEFYLIPTAEVPITNIYRDVILESRELPVKNCGYTPCFRREAGSYGAHVRGLNRLHQFDKVEVVQIANPENSYAILEEMCNHVMGLLDSLRLPYRKLLLCTGDMSFASAKTFDMEVWSAAQEKWLEVSSVSNFETFQASRLKCRFRDEDKKTQLVHTLNGSALALPRIVASLLENNQQADGSILIPEVLRPYTGFDRIG
ncbi:MAG: serine--tRNA ligase [Bacteroidia bacterium]|nr:serine--tRNA ligase [Bacteroidia bacterium]